MPKIDYKMMRVIHKSKIPGLIAAIDYERKQRYCNSKMGRLLKKLAEQAKKTRESIFLNICNRSYTGPPIYQPKTLKERLGENR